MPDLGHVALSAWSGGRYMHFGEPIDEHRLAALLTPDEAIHTVITADVYGTGEADRLVGRALRQSALGRDEICLVGAVGHDFVDGERDGPKGFPRFTDPRLRGPDGYADYLRRATEASLQRTQTDHFDLLLLHNPDRAGFTSEAVWDGMQRLKDDGLAHRIGVAPGPANGFTLDLIDCFERFGDRLDWAMVILNPLEPWPGELVLPAAAQHGIDVLCRVVDYGGLFHDDVVDPHPFAKYDHRKFRPEGWVARGREKMELMRPYAERHGLTMLQLACQWDLAHDTVACTAPTLIQEPDAPHTKPIEAKRAELAATPREVRLSAEEVQEIAQIGDNSGSMALKGASPDHEGEARPDRWELPDELRRLAARWEIDPERDLRQLPA